jgi:phage/plasmid-associated DNA primase
MNSYFEKYVEQGFVPFEFGKIHLDKNGKKQMKFPSWKDITKENCADFKMGESLAIRTGEISGITVIDFDTPEAYKETCAKYNIADTYTVRTRKGFHCYFEYCPFLPTATGVLPDVDVRNDNGIIIAPPTSYSDNDYNVYRYELVQDSKIMAIPLEFMHELQGSKQDDISSLGSTSEEQMEIKMGDYEKSILNNINPKYYTSYDDWLKFIWAIANSFENGIQIADDFSKTVNGYKGIHDVEKHIEDDSTHSISFSYLMNLSKKSNPVKHSELVASQKDIRYKQMTASFLESNKEKEKGKDIILCETMFNEEKIITEYHLAQLALSLIDTIIKKQDKIYVYENGYWNLDTTKQESKMNVIVQTTLRKILIKFQKYFMLTYDAEDELIQKKHKKICMLVIDACKMDKCKNIQSFYRMYLPESSVVFDNKPYLFCFLNKAYDLLTGKEHIVLKEDYITLRANYNYIVPTESQISLVQTLLSQIFPQEEIRSCYLSILFQGMTGIRAEKFFLANGSGRNGKGLINELFMSLLNVYGYILPVDVLTSKKEIGTGANPQIANCHKKRFILSREPEEGAKLRTSTIKEMTGGNEINARQLYSGECVVTMEQVQMLECNQKPQLSGTMNDAIQERIIDIPFVSLFTDVDKADEVNHIYPVNKAYKDEPFRLDHRCALFQILLASKKDLYIPAEIKLKSKEYVMSSDEIYMWMEECYEKGTEDDIITAKDLYNDYCASNVYGLLSKEEKRVMTKKNFTGLLKSSIGFRGKYRDDRKKIKNIEYYERLHGWKKKDLDELNEL